MRKSNDNNKNKCLWRASGFARRTTPSVFRRTLRMIPKDPLPMMSRGSYWSRNVEEDMVYCGILRTAKEWTGYNYTIERREQARHLNHHVIVTTGHKPPLVIRDDARLYRSPGSSFSPRLRTPSLHDSSLSNTLFRSFNYCISFHTLLSLRWQCQSINKSKYPQPIHTKNIMSHSSCRTLWLSNVTWLKG